MDTQTYFNQRVEALKNDPRLRYRGMIAMHRKAERAYRSLGNIEQAEAARKVAEECEKKLAELGE